MTDRLRLCATLQRPAYGWREALLEQIQGAVAGGVDLVQIREPDLPAGDLAALVRQAVSLTTGSVARIVVNERVDVAVATSAGGVHLPEHGIPVAQARRLAPEGFLVGRSIHGIEGIVSPAADYLVAGTVFPTVSKPGRGEMLGLDGLRAVVERAGSTPVLAIGGLVAARLPLVAQAGASGFAAIGAFLPEAGAPVAESVQRSVEQLRFAFDSDSSVF